MQALFMKLEAIEDYQHPKKDSPAIYLRFTRTKAVVGFLAILGEINEVAERPVVMPSKSDKKSWHASPEEYALRDEDFLLSAHDMTVRKIITHLKINLPTAARQLLKRLEAGYLPSPSDNLIAFLDIFRRLSDLETKA